MNSSGVFLNDLKKEIKFFNSRDFDEISKFSIENLSSIKDFNESCVFIFSISIFLLWFIKFVPIVLARILIEMDLKLILFLLIQLLNSYQIFEFFLLFDY